MVTFWFLARCQDCGWDIRTTVKAEFDRAVKAHKGTHE